MPASKTERLVNLVICLLASRTFVTKERLRATLEPYRNCPTDEAFERMFERDKKRRNIDGGCGAENGVNQGRPPRRERVGLGERRGESRQQGRENLG